jgi:hypothetical protein
MFYITRAAYRNMTPTVAKRGYGASETYYYENAGRSNNLTV